MNMRWWTYQKERFPIFQHGILVLAFSCSAVTYSSLATNTESQFTSYLVAFVTSFLFFLQLRIADEFKDAEEDAKYRPNRPVPRGLIKLKELGWVFVIAAIIQLILALLISPYQLVTLAIAWSYLALMSKEFFVRDWITAHPITYLWTHMLIMPLVDLYATSCHWIPAGEKPWLGLVLFLCASFFNGLVIELGRKLRQPQQEQEGVPTYSKLWGLKKASFIWLTCILLTGIFALLAAQLINALTLTAITLGTLFLVSTFLCFSPKWQQPKFFELTAAIWTLGLYLNLGILPALGINR